MWYVIWSLTGREEELINRIHELVPNNYYSQVWTPYRIKLKRHDGIDEKISLKMFPGYVFIDTENPEEIHEFIRREPDYISFLKTDDKYVPVSDSERDIIAFFTGEIPNGFERGMSTLGCAAYMIVALVNDSNVCTAPVFWAFMGVSMAVNR